MAHSGSRKNGVQILEHKFTDLVDPEDDFDAWFVCWCIVQQRFLTLRSIYLRLKVDDDSDLNEEDANETRMLFNSLSAAFLYEVLRLVRTRHFFSEQFANGPNGPWNEVQAAIDDLETTVFSALGEHEGKKILKDQRNAVFHVQIEWNETQTEPKVKPWPELRSSLMKVASEDVVHTIVVGDTVGTTKLSFTRHVEAWLLRTAVAKDVDDAEFAKRLKAFLPAILDSIGALDTVMMSMVRFQLARKGLANGSA